MPLMPFPPPLLVSQLTGAEYGIAGVSLVAVASAAWFLVRNNLASSDRREARLTTALENSQKAFLDHLKDAGAKRIEADLAVAKQLEHINETMKQHEERAQKRHETSLHITQQIAQQLAYYREQHEVAPR